MSLSPDEKPPFFKSWGAWYILVIGFLILLLFYSFFSPNTFHEYHRLDRT